MGRLFLFSHVKIQETVYVWAPFFYLPIQIYSDEDGAVRAHATFRSIHKEYHWIQWLGTDPNIISHYDVHGNLPGNKTSFWIYENALVTVTGVTDCADLSHVFRLVKCDHLCIRYKYKRFYTSSGPSDKIQRTPQSIESLRLFFRVEETADMWRIQWQIYVFLSLCAVVAFLRCREIAENGFRMVRNNAIVSQVRYSIIPIKRNDDKKACEMRNLKFAMPYDNHLLFYSYIKQYCHCAKSIFFSYTYF